MGFLTGKKLLITGVISNRSIAYGIAEACHREGAELAFTYSDERFAERLKGFAAQFGSDIVLPMDVTKDDQIAAVVETLTEKWGGLDGFVHSIGYAPRESIAGDFLEGFSRDAFHTALDISTYSYPALAKAFLPMMKGRNASCLTLTYLGESVPFQTTTRWVWLRQRLMRQRAIWLSHSAVKAFAPMPFPPVRSRRSLHPALRALASFCV